jgi:hypothetical protein
MKRARHLLAAAALAIASTFAVIAYAEVSVPAKLQAQLIAKIAAFDRNFAARAGGNALILVVYKPGDAESMQLAQQLAAELRGGGDVGGVAKTVEVVAYAGAGALAAACSRRSVAIVYLSGELDADASAIANALAGGNVLSVGATGAHAENGAVVGFDLEGGKARIVVNLAAARAQNVALKAELLRLTRIVGG